MGGYNMKKEHFDSFREHFDLFFKGDLEAVDMVMMLIEISNTWDDIVDGDKPSELEINKAFTMCLIHLPNNGFYIDNQYELRPIILSTILKWTDANKLERNKEHLHKAYMLRAGLYDIIAHVAFLIGGEDWYNEVGVSIRKLYGEDFKIYEEEMLCQIQ